MNDETQVTSETKSVAEPEYQRKKREIEEAHQAYLEKKEPVEIVGFNITILEWVVILFKLNIAVAILAIPAFIIILILTSS